jgi:hypothetical protein
VKKVHGEKFSGWIWLDLVGLEKQSTVSSPQSEVQEVELNVTSRNFALHGVTKSEVRSLEG